MWATKYDWAKLKLEYMLSEIEWVKPFLLQRLWVKDLSWSMIPHITGWWKEKQAYKQKILEKALERNAKEQAKSLELTTEFLKKAKKNALIKIAKQITEDDLISMKNLVIWLWTIKTELWEPTKITKNENTNFNNEELSEEDQAILEKIFKNKWNE